MSDAKEIRTLRHCVFNLNVHLVLVTKYRRRCLTSPMLERLRELSQKLAAQWNCELLEFNGEADHVHLLLSLAPTVAPSEFINNLKTVTSRAIRRECEAHLSRYYWRFKGIWSRSYCVLSSGGAPLEVLKRYIENQERPE